MTDTKELFSLLLWSVGICYTNFSMMKLEMYKWIIGMIILKSAEFCMIIIWGDYDTKYNWFFHYWTQ